MQIHPWLRRQCHTTAPRLRILTATTLSCSAAVIAGAGPWVAPHFYPNKEPTALTACLIVFAFGTGFAGLLVTISHNALAPPTGKRASRKLMVLIFMLTVLLGGIAVILGGPGINMVRE